MSQYYIRPMREEDIPQVSAIEALVFPTPWSEHAFRSELADNLMAMYLVIVTEEEKGDRVLGYGGMWQIFDEAHITNIAIHPDYQGLKLGRFLVHAMIQWAWDNEMKHMTLEVRPSNAAALTVYQAAGFSRVGLRPGYYTDTGEDAVIMWIHKEEKDGDNNGSSSKTQV